MEAMCITMPHAGCRGVLRSTSTCPTTRLFRIPLTNLKAPRHSACVPLWTSLALEATSLRIMRRDGPPVNSVVAPCNGNVSSLHPTQRWQILVTVLNHL